MSTLYEKLYLCTQDYVETVKVPNICNCCHYTTITFTRSRPYLIEVINNRVIINKKFFSSFPGCHMCQKTNEWFKWVDITLATTKGKFKATYLDEILSSQ